MIFVRAISIKSHLIVDSANVNNFNSIDLLSASRYIINISHTAGPAPRGNQGRRKTMTSHPNRSRSTETVTLIRHRSGFANVPDTFRVTGEPDRADPYTETDETYWLPTGYSVAESAGGMLCIYDRNDVHCDIIEHSCGRPQLVSGISDMPVLKRAE